jgi:hypothetical protein
MKGRSMKTTVLAIGVTTCLALTGCRDQPNPSGAGNPPAAAAKTAAPTAASAPPEAKTFVVAPSLTPDDDVEFKAVLDLEQAPKGGEPELRGGQEANSTDWPASLYATFSTPRGPAACTAALLGPKVMLTAAHCVPSSGIVKFSYEGHAQSYTATCTKHPKYTAAPPDKSADYALCTVAPRFAAPVGFLYETVNLAGMSTHVKQTVVLAGYGCVSSIVAKSGQIDGKYRVGFNSIVETSDTPEKTFGEAFYAGRENNNLFTADDPSRSNLCPGDSGGPMFVRPQSGSASQFANRTIAGVNSRVFYTDATETAYGSSLISATGGPDFRDWATKWAQASSVSACGIAGTLPNCRR